MPEGDSHALKGSLILIIINDNDQTHIAIMGRDLSTDR